MHRLLLLACLTLSVGTLSGCGLVTREEPIGFRTYTLEDVGYGEGIEVVHEAVRKYAIGHFGGVGITFDPVTGNLELDPVYEGRRRMRLYIRMVARPPDLDLEMLALVEHLELGKLVGEVGWQNPQMDVPLEEGLYQVIVQELLARRAAATLP